MTAFGGFNLTSSLSGGIGIPSAFWAFSAKHILIFHVTGTQLTVGQRTFAERWPFWNQLRTWINISLLYKDRVSRLSLPAVFDGMHCLYKLHKARFAGIVTVVPAELGKLSEVGEVIFFFFLLRKLTYQSRNQMQGWKDRSPLCALALSSHKI